MPSLKKETGKSPSGLEQNVQNLSTTNLSNMRYFYIIAFLCLFLGFNQNLKAQQKKTVTGTVSDNAGGIPSVNIFYNRTAIGTTSTDGSFSVSVPEDAVLEF